MNTQPDAAQEQYRHAIAARRPFNARGGACTLLVLRVGAAVVLALHAATETSAVLTTTQATELADALSAAAGKGQTGR